MYAMGTRRRRGGAIGQHGAEPEVEEFGSGVFKAAGGVLQRGQHSGEARGVEWRAGQAELVKLFSAERWLAWRGERSPNGEKEERVIEAIGLSMLISCRVKRFLTQLCVTCSIEQNPGNLRLSVLNSMSFKCMLNCCFSHRLPFSWLV
jgi:hypothetical protein